MKRRLREGTIPTVVGTAVAITGAALIPVAPLAAAGVAGFGLGHVVLGGIDMFQHRRRR